MAVSNWLKNLSLRGKFSLLSGLALLMLALPSTRLLHGDWQAWQVAEREAAGVGPAIELLQWVRLTQQHRGLSAALLAGDTNQAASREARFAEADAAAAQLLGELALFDAAGLPQRAAELRQQAQALAQAVAQRQLDGSQSLRRHAELIDHQLRLLQDLAQASGLALDRQPALLNLQAGVLTQLPRLTEQLGQLRARGARALSAPNIAPEERARVESQLEQAQQLLEQSQRAFDLAREARPNELAPLAIPLAESRQAALASLALSQAQLVQEQSTRLTPAEFFAQQTQFIDRQFALMDRALDLLRQEVLAQASAARLAIATLLGSLLLLSGLAGWILWRVAVHTSAAIGEAVGMAQAVAAGDLSRQVEISSRDEAGQLLGALQRMNDQLTTVVGDVRQNADGVATAATQIAQGNQDLSNRTEQQASALQQTAASMEQLGATVRQNAEHAQQANELALGTADMAQRGGSVMQQVVQTMHGIHESSRRIEDIIGVIDGIAFQTNILALNAAVEAARAGEQGRGFAVVAAEVRALAQRSAGAAREIKSLIGTSVSRVEQGNSLVDQAGQTIAEVVRQAESLRALMAQISTASAEQSSGVQQVGQAVSEMDRVTQQNAALVEQSAAAAESLQQQAQRLVDAVAVFQLRLR